MSLWDDVKKTHLIEIAKDFGGRDQRKAPGDLPPFSPETMILALDLGISEREFISILNVKRRMPRQTLCYPLQWETKG